MPFLEFGKASTPLKETIDSDSVFDDFEHLGVNDETTDSNKTSGFTVITNKNPDEVIKSFFENPKQFSNQNNVFSDAPSSTTVVKKFTKLSQKERKKQLLKEETSPPAQGNLLRGIGNKTVGRYGISIFLNMFSSQYITHSL